MTNQEKAVMYEAIVSEGDRLNREKSKLKAENAGINMSKETEMSIADIAIWRLLGWLKSGMLEGIPKNICDNFTKLNNVHSEVHKHPKIQEWMHKTYGKEI